MNGDVALAALTADEAERLTRRIELKLGIIADNYDSVMPMIREAIERGAAEALGYKGVSDYIADRFGAALSRIGMDMRGEVVRELSAAGMSVRSIAPVVGVSVGQVQADKTSGVQSLNTSGPSRTVGMDGKSYPATQPQYVDTETGEVNAPRRERAYSPRTDVVLTMNSALTRARDAAFQADQIKREHLKDRSEEAATWGRSLSESMQSLQRLMDLLTEASR